MEGEERQEEVWPEECEIDEKTGGERETDGEIAGGEGVRERERWRDRRIERQVARNEEIQVDKQGEREICGEMGEIVR